MEQPGHGGTAVKWRNIPFSRYKLETSQTERLPIVHLEQKTLGADNENL